MADTVICANKEDAKFAGDNIGWKHIVDWNFLDNGKIELILDCKVGDLNELS